METWMIITLAVAYLAFGIVFVAPRYEKRLDEFEQKLQRARPNEQLEFSVGKELRWCLFAAVAWWFVYPYERKTGWRQWTYPYCLPEGAPEGWNNKMPALPSYTVKIKPGPLNLPGYPKILPQADTIAAIKVSGKAAAEEVNKRVENAGKNSSELLKKRITV